MQMNVATPETAFDLSFIPNDGVGLARLEFIIAQNVRVHPMALLQFEKVKDTKIRKEIEEFTRNYKVRSDFFVDMLAQGIAKIAAAFYPNAVRHAHERFQEQRVRQPDRREIL